MHEEVLFSHHKVFGEEYLRKPNQANVDRLLQVAKPVIFWYVWMHRFYALGVEELFSWMEGFISKRNL